MAVLEQSKNRLEWYYALPVKKDRTLTYKLLQAYLITMGVFAGILVLVALAGPPVTLPVIVMLLEVFAIIGGFLAVVMILCYPLTILLIKLLVLWISLPVRLVRFCTGKSKEDSAAKEENKQENSEKDKTTYSQYHFIADEEKLHSWGVMESKGGKHIRYSSVRKLICRKEKNLIEVHTLLGKTIVYVDDEHFETVWDFLDSHCFHASAIKE